MKRVYEVSEFILEENSVKTQHFLRIFCSVLSGLFNPKLIKKVENSKDYFFAVVLL
ncbi:hypothetical protein NIES4103_00790 [Nostoc sp. NIES-4103]|nr:hypothetical protein NIES4103_00790 [Nostoc sp. NIES-4103]